MDLAAGNGRVAVGGLVAAQELRVDIDYGQLYVYGRIVEWVPEAHPDDERLRGELAEIIGSLDGPGECEPGWQPIIPASPRWTAEHLAYFGRQQGGSPYELVVVDDGYRRKIGIGVSGGLVSLLAVVQWHFDAPLRAERWDTEPVGGYADWDHVVEVDVDVSREALFFSAPPDWPERAWPVPDGRYRMRIGGGGYDVASGHVEGGSDRYLVQLWPREADGEPVSVKQWPGMAVRLV
jgi:hypothetical protein